MVVLNCFKGNNNAGRTVIGMPGREKVIKGVHNARRYLEDREWVDKSVGVHIDALNDVLALLKEQESVVPRVSTAEQRCGH
jgi:hypothetical protein